jgi:hypothetical protein
MTVGSRNPAKLTERRVGVCVICTKNITHIQKWSRIRRPLTGPAHDECVEEDK